MTKHFSLPLVGVTIAVALLSGCSSEPTCDYSDAPYVNAQSVPSLRAPEGLTTPDRTASLVIPALPDGAVQPPSGKGACLDRPPSYFATTQAATGSAAAKDASQPK